MTQKQYDRLVAHLEAKGVTGVELEAAKGRLVSQRPDPLPGRQSPSFIVRTKGWLSRVDGIFQVQPYES